MFLSLYVKLKWNKKHSQQTQNFCRNKYNVTGLCNKASCPLANSRYATVLPSKDGIYLHSKTIERAHSPKNLWKKVKLSEDSSTAKKEIEQNLQFWSNALIDRCKKRFSRIKSYIDNVKQLRNKNRQLIYNLIIILLFIWQLLYYLFNNYFIIYLIIILLSIW